MILKTFDIKELKMNGMSVGFESGEGVIEAKHVNLFGHVNLRSLEWTIKIDYIDTNLEYIHKFKKVIKVEMVTDKGKEFSGLAFVSAMEGKVLTELTGVDKLNGYEVKFNG